MDDFWIGDHVKIISSGKTGIYEGVKDGKARIRYGSKYIITMHKNLQKLPEEEHQIDIFEDIHDFSSIKTIKEKFLKQIDLHIEKLAPERQNLIPEMILDFQIKSANDFIQVAISRKIFSVIIIHGKGNGALKMEIEHLLGDFPQVLHFYTLNDGGATEVIFKYY